MNLRPWYPLLVGMCLGATLTIVVFLMLDVCECVRTRCRTRSVESVA